MHVDIYNKDFQNWFKGNLALNETRKPLCETVSSNIVAYISEFSQDQRAHIVRFIACLDENGIHQFKKHNDKEIVCSHHLCKTLLQLFTEKHQEKHGLRYKWRIGLKRSTYPSMVHIDKAEQIWRVAKLYMFIEPGEKMENYRCLDDLDISKLLKMMRNCNLFVHDGSLEIYDKVIEFRNDLMHSPNNIVKGEYLQEKLENTRDLLTILGMASDCDVLQYLKKLEMKDFTFSYHSEEYKNVVAEVAKAKDIASALYKEIIDTNSRGKTNSKNVMDILEKICKNSHDPQLGMKPKEFRNVVKHCIEMKKQALELETTICLHSCSRDSDRYKELEKLQKRTEQDLKDINEQLMMNDETEMAELIDHLIKNATILERDKTKLEHEINEMTNKIDHVNKIMAIRDDQKSTENEFSHKTKTDSEKYVTDEFPASDPAKLNQSKKHNKQPSEIQTNAVEIMEPDNTADKAASMAMGSKQTYVESVGKSQQFSQTRNVGNVRKGPPAPKSAHTSSHKFEEELEARIKEVSLRKSSGFSPNDLEVFQKPVCLISTDEGNALKLETEVAEQIAKIDWPIVVVSVVGLYRTGKSYLMNRLAQSTTGFALGDAIESKTKGIWVWCKIHPERTNTVLVLLDTEGLGDIDKGDPSHDNKIFTLATLLCNCLVYNMKGAFDQDAVSKLTFITEMAKNIRFRGKSFDDDSCLKLILPDFVLCVRDFGLKFVKDGKSISEDEYLETGLAIQEGKDDKFNKPRECIQKYFPVRKCFTFPVPGDGDVIENLETLDFSQLSKRFKEATNRFVSYIYSRKSKELLASKPINGQMFTTLATHYVTAIRHGAVPDVDDAFSAAAKIENSRIRQQALEIFQKQMETISLPVPSKVLESLFMTAQQTALDYLRKDVVHDKDGQCENTAQMEMDNRWNKLKEENTQKVQEKCEATILQAYEETMERKIKNKTYEVSGGHRMFQTDIAKMKKEFMSKLEFEENEVSMTWIWFMKMIEKTETKIIEADDGMSAKEKEDERKRNEENLKKLKEEYQKSEQNNIEKQRIAMEEHFKRLEHDRKESNEKEIENYKMFLETKVEKEQLEKELQRVLKKQQKEKKKRIDMEEEKVAKDRQLQASRAQNEMMERERQMERGRNAKENESSCVIS